MRTTWWCYFIYL